MPQFSDLYGSLLDIELGTADTIQLFTTARRKAAINRAQKRFNEETECFQRKASITLVDETQEYDIEATATDFLWIAKDDVDFEHYDGTNTTWYSGPEDFPRVDVPALNKDQPGWRGASSGLPVSYYIRLEDGKTYIGLYPAPDIPAAHTWKIHIPYVADPADMSADADEPYSISSNPLITLRPWHQALVHYAAGELEGLRKNYAIRTAQLQRFAAYVASYIQKQRRKGGHTLMYARDYLGERTTPDVPDPYRYP